MTIEEKCPMTIEEKCQMLGFASLALAARLPGLGAQLERAGLAGEVAGEGKGRQMATTLMAVGRDGGSMLVRGICTVLAVLVVNLVFVVYFFVRRNRALKTLNEDLNLSTAFMMDRDSVFSEEMR